MSAPDFNVNNSMLSLDSLHHSQDQGMAEEEEAEATLSLEASSQIVRAIFGSAVGQCWGDFFCTHNRIRGRLYATSLAVLFHSNLLGFERRICLRYCEIVEMELYRTTSIRVTMFDSEQYILRSFNDRVQVLRMLNGLKILSERRSIGAIPGRPQQTQLQSLPNLALPGSQSDVSDLQSWQQEQRVSRPNSEGSSMSASLPSQSSWRRLSMSSDQQRQPLISNRRRAASDSCATTTALSTSSATGTGLLQPFGIEDSELDNNEGLSVVDDVSVDEMLVRSTVGEAWSKERDRILSASDFNVGIDSVVLPVTLERFHELFLADGACFSLDWFQETCIGDRDIELTGWDVDTDEQVLKRSMMFTHPINNRLGPSQARTTRHQRLKRFDDHGMLVENTTVIVDNIPAVDSFYVHDYWVIQASSSDSQQVILSTRFAARFTKRALFRGLIEKNVIKEATAWFSTYAEMVQSKLQQPPQSSAVGEATNAEGSIKTSIVAQPVAPPVMDSNLSIVIDLLRRLSSSMDRALMVGACALVVLVAILAYQLLLMQSAIDVMRNELASLRIEVATAGVRHFPECAIERDAVCEQ